MSYTKVHFLANDYAWFGSDLHFIEFMTKKEAVFYSKMSCYLVILACTLLIRACFKFAVSGSNLGSCYNIFFPRLDQNCPSYLMEFSPICNARTVFIFYFFQFDPYRSHNYDCFQLFQIFFECKKCNVKCKKDLIGKWNVYRCIDIVI